MMGRNQAVEECTRDDPKFLIVLVNSNLCILDYVKVGTYLNMHILMVYFPH